MPVRTRSQDRLKGKDKMKQHSPRQERLYPDLQAFQDFTESSPKQSPAVARRDNRGKKGNYRDLLGNDSSDTDSAGNDLDDSLDDDEFSPKRVNVSSVSRGSRNRSSNRLGEDQSFNNEAFSGTDDDSNLNGSKFSPNLTSQDISYNSSFFDNSSPGVRKRHSPDLRRKESPNRSYIETVSEYSDGGNRIWTIPDYCIYCVLALFVIALLYGLYVRKMDESSPVVQDESMEKLNLEQLKKKLDEMRQKFPNQTERYWKIIGAQLKKLFHPGPQTQPAIILFAAPPHAVEAMNCIAKEIGKAFTEITNSKTPVVVHGGELASKEDNQAKLELDETLSDGFRSGHRVVIMFELESFHGQPLLLLHSYCDHENAGFKDVVIIFTLRLDTNEAASNINDEFVEDYLASIWQNKVGVDEMGALRSRVANNKAISQAELDHVLNSHCS